MDNLGFDVDESLEVVGQVAPGPRCNGCVAVYQTGGPVQLRACGVECSHETVNVYGCMSGPSTPRYTVYMPVPNCPKKQRRHPLWHIPLFLRTNLEKQFNAQTTLKKVTTTMPSNTEEVALLSVVSVPVESWDGQGTMLRRTENQCKMVRVPTDCGELVVAVQGDVTKPPIFTYHDLGVNHLSFLSFFNYVDMRALRCHFCVYHINAPGQEEGAPTMPIHVYPSMDELANQLNYVMIHFGLRSFIGFGVGFGANILARFALAHPTMVDSLVLINCVSTKAGWVDWTYQRMMARQLRNHGMTQSPIDAILWHHFGRVDRVRDLTEVYRSDIIRTVNPFNLALLVDQYARRSDLGISREHGTLKVPVLNITGSMSPQQEDTVMFNARLDPQTSTWMKISDCSNIIEEKPAKVAEAFRLFLQGEGYVAPLSPTKMQWFRRTSRPCRAAIINITENPISDAIAC